MNDDSERMKKKTLLLNYYAQNGTANNNNNNADSISITTTGEISNDISTNIKETNNLTRNPFDMNAPSFEPDSYLKKLIKVRKKIVASSRDSNNNFVYLLISKEKNLVDIMDIENEIAKETRKLDSEMQTLVSENYNKFISATDTIRKVRKSFICVLFLA